MLRIRVLRFFCCSKWVNLLFKFVSETCILKLLKQFQEWPLKEKKQNFQASKKEKWDEKIKLKRRHDRDFPDGAVVRNSPASERDKGDVGSIPGLGRFPGVEIGNLLQYSCLENYMNRGDWLTTVHKVAKSQTQLSMHAIQLKYF